MTTEQTIQVELAESRGYSIQIGAGLLESAGEATASLNDVSRVALISDERVEPLYAERVVKSILDAGLDVDVLVVPEGEASKSIEATQELWRTFLEWRLDRKSLVVALGGGVVGDLSGFAASTFARGIRFFQIPTTLLAQVDSSVGGKVGVNFDGTKNMIGAFHQPKGVLVDPTSLETLSDRQYRAGLGEVVKYGSSLDESFFLFLENRAGEIDRRDSDVLTQIVARCCRLKADVVVEDERETSGRRALLNYGHTFAHAFEETAGPGSVLHGEAVAVGLVLAIRLALKLEKKSGASLLNAEFLQRQIRLHQNLRLPTSIGDFLRLDPNLDRDAFLPEKILRFMKFDKKNENGRLCFVLPTRIGRCDRIADVEPDDVVSVLEESF